MQTLSVDTQLVGYVEQEATTSSFSDYDPLPSHNLQGPNLRLAQEISACRPWLLLVSRVRICSLGVRFGG